ncbi:MAG: AMP-binding protein [Chlamydiae bacterium]|nr:AMP-binding protein [Chlamydiota bacterium]
MGLFYRLLYRLGCLIVRLLLSLRYRITLDGWEEVLSLRGAPQGILFLPNHPAEVDPILLIAYLGPFFYPRGVIVEHFYRLRGFKRLLDFTRVIPIPSMDEKTNRWRKKELEKAIKGIQRGLAKGDNFLIYPSGRLKKSGLEQLGGASLVHSLLQEQEDRPVVLIRITGLWGSRFSTSATGRSPPFGKTLRQAFIVLLKNGFFFAPRRKVHVTFAVNPSLPKQDRLVCNRALESWYNCYPMPGEEPLTLVRDSWFSHHQELTARKENSSKKETYTLPLSVEEELYEMLSSLSKMPKESISQMSSLSRDLGLDSLDVAEIVAFLDKKYDAAWMPLEELQYVHDVWKSVAERSQGQKEKKNVEAARLPMTTWFTHKERKELAIPQGDTLAEVFLASCQRMGSHVACADATSGVFSYRKLRQAALVLSLSLRSLPGQEVGVLLPSSVAVYLIIQALWLAGKVPVLLNWTAGVKALNHALDVGEFSVTLTSRRFLDRIPLEELGKVEDTFIFLEDLREDITFTKKIKGFCMSLYPLQRLLAILPVEKDPQKPAVLLFTSGSEALPKAVPLSHAHLLANLRNAVLCTKLQKEESLYGVLPPFHSFGFSLTGVFPLLYGLKVFYAPDPTDGHTMAEDLEKMQLEILCLAPSFLAHLFSVAHIEQLKSLRLVVSGAEKPRPFVRQFVRDHLPKADWMEGYGITECSPVVSLTIRGGEEEQGVGKPIHGLTLCCIDPDSLEVLSHGEVGEICISGPSVFDGYLKEDRDPFLYKEGRRWYRSGDLGFFDSKGYLHIVERIKRTVKLGGEMLSLTAIEQELSHIIHEKMHIASSSQGPALALLVTKSEKPELILFSTAPLKTEEINAALRTSGLGRLAKISRTQQVSEIPVMGTGKIHYRKLEEQLG